MVLIILALFRSITLIRTYQVQLLNKEESTSHCRSNGQHNKDTNDNEDYYSPLPNANLSHAISERNYTYFQNAKWGWSWCSRRKGQQCRFIEQQGSNFLNQNHFLRYVADKWVAKVEYNENGFVDIRYFEASQRFRKPIGDKFSLNIGTVQRLSKPYGYDPLNEWVLDNGSLHYTFLALEEMGYSISIQDGEYYDPDGNVVATSPEVWDEVVIPQVLADYASKKQNEIDRTIEYSAVIGFDYYHYDKDFWLHSWGNLMPYHIDTDNEFSYHKYNNGQWLDYSGGLIFGYRYNKHLGVFLEGKYNKYWNREWHDFSLGLNYVIF